MASVVIQFRFGCTLFFSVILQLFSMTRFDTNLSIVFFALLICHRDCRTAVVLCVLLCSNKHVHKHAMLEISAFYYIALIFIKILSLNLVAEFY